MEEDTQFFTQPLEQSQENAPKLFSSKEAVKEFLDELVAEMDKLKLPNHVGVLAKNLNVLWGAKSYETRHVWKDTITELLQYLERLIEDEYGLEFMYEEADKGNITYRTLLFAFARAAMYRLKGKPFEVLKENDDVVLKKGEFSIEMSTSVIVNVNRNDARTYEWEQYGEIVGAQIGFDLYCMASGAHHDPAKIIQFLETFYCMIFAISCHIFP